MAHISYQSRGVHGGSTVLTWTALSCHYSSAPKPSDSQWACLQLQPSSRHVGSNLHSVLVGQRCRTGATMAAFIVSSFVGKSWERN